MGCVQSKDKEATKITDDWDTPGAGYRYEADPTPRQNLNFSIPNYNVDTPVGQCLTVFGGVTSCQTGTLRTRGGTGNGSVKMDQRSHLHHEPFQLQETNCTNAMHKLVLDGYLCAYLD